jgi:hypothetical protein
MADQPYNAVHLSENPKVAIELIEVRTGESGLKPPRRNGRATKGTRNAVREEFLGFIDDICGLKGADLRATVQGLQSEYMKTWKEEGEAQLELQAFLREFVLQD